MPSDDVLNGDRSGGGGSFISLVICSSFISITGPLVLRFMTLRANGCAMFSVDSYSQLKQVHLEIISSPLEYSSNLPSVLVISVKSFFLSEEL